MSKKSSAKHRKKTAKASVVSADTSAPSGAKSRFTHAVDVAEALPDKVAMQVAEVVAGLRAPIL